MTIRPEHLRSIVSRIEELDAQIAALNSEKADAYQEAKGAKADVAAMRLVISERRKREKDPSKFEILQGTAEEYRSILDGGTEPAHTRVHAQESGRPRKNSGAGASHLSPGDAGASISSSAPQPAPETKPRSDVEASPTAALGTCDHDWNIEGAGHDVCRSCGEVRSVPFADPDAGWERADAARNYNDAVGAIRAGIVASGQARLQVDDMPPIPDFLRRVSA